MANSSDEFGGTESAPTHDRRVIDLIGQKVESAISPRSQEREYGAILPISWERGATPGNARFDIKGGITGDILGLIGAGSSALRGRSYNPMDITRGLMTISAPDLARSRPSTVLRSAGESNAPRLPESLKPISETTLAPDNTLRRALQNADAGILAPEQTARAARYSSPEAMEYLRILQERRDAWSRMDWSRKTLQDYITKLQEPNLTDEGIFKIQNRVQRARQRYQEAVSAARTLGVKETDPFPVDVRLTAEIGTFPGDHKYMYRSYAPEGYPFSGSHDYHNPAYRIPD